MLHELCIGGEPAYVRHGTYAFSKNLNTVSEKERSLVKGRHTATETAGRGEGSTEASIDCFCQSPLLGGRTAAERETNIRGSVNCCWRDHSSGTASGSISRSARTDTAKALAGGSRSSVDMTTSARNKVIAAKMCVKHT